MVLDIFRSVLFFGAVGFLGQKLRIMNKKRRESDFKVHSIIPANNGHLFGYQFYSDRSINQITKYLPDIMLGCK